MTDRIAHLTVYLDKELRDDEPLLERIEQAISMVAHVANIDRGEPTNLFDVVRGRREVDRHWRDKMIALLNEDAF